MTTRRLDEVPDPARVARSLRGAGRPWFWLDGEAAAAAGDPRGMSYLGSAADVRMAEPGEELAFLEGLRPERGHDPSSSSSTGSGSGTDTGAGTGLGTGWVVALGYEFGAGLLGVRPVLDDAAPAFALRVECVLAIDHAAGAAELRGRSADQLDGWWAAHGARAPLDGLGGSAGQDEPREGAGQDGPGGSAGQDEPRGPGERDEPLGGAGRAEPTGASGRTGAPPDPSWRHSDARYAELVARCKAAIADGDAYVLCLTDTATLEAVDAADPLDLFLGLRRRGGALRGGVIDLGDRALVSASPERFLSVREDGAGERTVETRPIKGTRPRGESAVVDAGLAAELAADPKERAENLMIVDLMRNDLSRVCVPGTVGVEGFLSVETHPHVHQLVSTVVGRLRPDADACDAIAAAFPGGSMTGAPKRRAVEILSSLEAGPRGLYAGCFGWIGDGGEAELAMTIRGVELRGGRALVGAGGGVTADSSAAGELAEKHLKAGPVLSAIRDAVEARTRDTAAPEPVA